MKLKDIADIGTGLVLNRKKADVDDKNVKKYKMITLKSINSDGFIEKDLMEEFSLEPGPELGKILKIIEEKIVKNELKNEQAAIFAEVKKMLWLNFTDRNFGK